MSNAQNNAAVFGNTNGGDFVRRFKILKKHGALMVFGGLAYGLIEILWRGKTHWAMILTGGFCFSALVGIYKKCARMFIVKKCMLGGALITFCEYLCGTVVNIKLKLNVWDYSKCRFNVKGQICPFYSVLWSLLCLPICALSRVINRKELSDDPPQPSRNKLSGKSGKSAGKAA